MERLGCLSPTMEPKVDSRHPAVTTPLLASHSIPQEMSYVVLAATQNRKPSSSICSIPFCCSIESMMPQPGLDLLLPLLVPTHDPVGIAANSVTLRPQSTLTTSSP